MKAIDKKPSALKKFGFPVQGVAMEVASIIIYNNFWCYTKTNQDNYVYVELTC